MQHSLDGLIGPARKRASLSPFFKLSGESDEHHTSTNKSRWREVAAIGGGVITPAVVAHVRRKIVDSNSRPPQNRAAERKAVIGGGVITTPAVATHVRRNAPNAGQAANKQAIIGGGVITTLVVAAHIRRTMATPNQR